MSPHARHRELKTLGAVLHGAGLAVTLALLALGAWIAVAPLEARRDDHLQRAEHIEQLLLRRPHAERELRALTGELEAVQRRKDELRRRITDGTREGEFFGQVSEVARQVGLHLVNFSPVSISRDGAYGTVRVQFVCRGRYESICRFLERLDKLPRLATTARMKIAAPVWGEVYDFQLTLDIYFASSKAVAATSAGEGRGV